MFKLLLLFHSLSFFTDGILAVQAASPSSQPQLLHCRNSSCSSCFLQSLSFFAAGILAVQAASPSSQPQLSSLMELWLTAYSSSCSSCLSFFTAAAFFTDRTLADPAASPSSLPQLSSLIELWLIQLPLLLYCRSFLH
jgi:hypothetical protein